MPTVEIESAERGWLASIGLDQNGLATVNSAATPELERALSSLLQRLLEEPLEGTLLGERRGDDLLYGLADAFGRRRPLLGMERVFGYVQGGSRAMRSAPTPPGWDEP